jgi:arginyl-tRNA synthetase
MFKEEIVSMLAKALKKKEEDILPLLESPPDPEFGDLAFPCFSLAKELKKSPQKIAEDIVKIMSLPKSVAKVEVKGAYVNFFFSKEDLAEKTLAKIRKGSYGKGVAKKERVMVEYCQVNTHKAFHVGHLRGTLLGQALVNILRFDGFSVFAANYQGDIGTHVAKSVWYLTKFNKENIPLKAKGAWLGRIYQKANKKIAEKEEYAEEVQDVLKQLEDGDKKLLSLWEKTRKYSLDDFEVIYRTLGVKFDEYFFESQMEKPGKEMVHSLVKAGLAKESEGAIIIDLEKVGLGVFLLLKKDGTALYSTKDLALAKIKFEKFGIEKSLYVVGSEQTLYFQQLFKTLELMGFAQSKNCFHLPYGVVTLAGGKISSREGELITAEDLIKKVVAQAEKEVESRHEGWPAAKKKKTAESIALAGVKFGMIVHDPHKEISFQVEKAVEFEGETGPYIQYTHARICSIIRKAGKKIPKEVQYGLLQEEKEKGIIKALLAFPTVIGDAALQYKPALVARYLLSLCQEVNNYYHEVPILKSGENMRNAKLVLISCVRDIVAEGLSLLGIEAPEEM